MQCQTCKRELDQPSDPLSKDCGGDCWGCVNLVEAWMADVPLDEYRADPARYLPSPD
jgi:hypothetical protein